MVWQEEYLNKYGVGTESFRAHDFAVFCNVGEEMFLDPQEAMVQLLTDYVNTKNAERKFLRDLIMKEESEEQSPIFDFVDPGSIGKFRGPSIKLIPDFSPERRTMGQLFEKYLSGEFGEGGKVKKSEIARFGHLEKSARENFSKALRTGADRRNATFEFMAICCLFFKVEPTYAITLFHKCIGVDELQSYRYIGGALWLFLEDENYDYELYVRTCCQMLKSEHLRLPDAVAKSRYWNEVYEKA